MAVRGKQTFQKLQKERARKDKQQRKAERRAERKEDGPNSEELSLDEMKPLTGPILHTDLADDFLGEA